MPGASKQSTSVIAAAITSFRSQKQLADGAIRQISDEKLRRPLDADTNSIAVIMKHLGGNLLSRWKDFLTTDGDKPTRDRDNEFIEDFPDRATILAHWERGWACLFDSLSTLTDGDLFKTITIRTEPHNVIDALLRSLSHTSYHVGQIVQTARHYAGDNWTTLTVPRGGTKAHDEALKRRVAGQ
jgi:hypothetical protein